MPCRQVEHQNLSMPDSFSAHQLTPGTPDTTNQTEIFQMLKQLVWHKVKEGDTAEKAMLIIMREIRERERAVWSPFSLLRIIACMLAEADREREERRTSAEPQWRHCGSAALPVYRRSVCVSCLHGNGQHINTRELVARERERERDKKRESTGKTKKGQASQSQVDPFGASV